MKTFLKLLCLVGLVWPALGAQPPVVRNGWTTNAEALLPIRVYSPTYAYLGAAIVPNFHVPDDDTFFMGTLAGLADDGSANDSIGFGIGSLQVCSNGLGNFAFGSSTLNDLTNASGILGLGYYNSAFGYQAGNGIDCGVDGIYIGRQTGPLHGGYYNICIGALSSYENLKTNTVSIGYNAASTGDNIFVLGDTNMDRYVFRGQIYTFPPVRGTNEYLFIGDGGQLYWTNVVSFTTNISGDSFVTNLTVYSNAYFYSTAYINNSYITNLTVVSNAFFNETIYVNNAYITNLTVVSNAYFPKNLYVSNLFVTNIENAPGPFVLQPHAPTNGFPNALSLSNGTGITFSTNGQFLVVGATATGGGSTNGFMPLQIQSVSLPNANYMIIDRATNFTWSLLSSNGWYCYWSSMVAPDDYMSNTLSLALTLWPQSTNPALSVASGTNEVVASIMMESSDGTTDGSIDAFDGTVTNTITLPSALQLTTNTVIDFAGKTDNLVRGRPFHIKLQIYANPAHTNFVAVRSAQLRYVRQ